MKHKLPSWHLVNKILVLCDARTIKLEILINPKKNMDHGRVSLIGWFLHTIERQFYNYWMAEF